MEQSHQKVNPYNPQPAGKQKYSNTLRADLEKKLDNLEGPDEISFDSMIYPVFRSLTESNVSFPL